MRRMILLLACLETASVTQARDPEIDVICPAVSFDDHNDRGGNGPDNPHPVVLMVVGKTQASTPKTARKAPASQLRSDQPGYGTQTLLVDHVLFGSPPGHSLRIEADGYGVFPDDADQVPYIYGFVSSVIDGKVRYGRDGYYLWDRTYAIEQLPQVKALAMARLDLLVLGSHAVVIGRPAKEVKASGALTVTVERPLSGPFQAGDQIELAPIEQLPIPLASSGPFVYFVHRNEAYRKDPFELSVTTRWSIDTVDTILTSLARGNDYPIRNETDDSLGEKRVQEILFRGPRSAAIELLQGHRDPLRILGERRLRLDGKQAVAEIAKQIEKHLWLEKIDGQPDFQWQENMIRLLGELEEHRSDGHVTRLVGQMLTAAERGAALPIPLPDDKADSPWARSYYNRLDATHNHSLTWLLQTLDEADVTRLFGQRLLDLRHLTSYGWLNEAQEAIDQCHVEDHLELATVEPVSKRATTIHWSAGFRGDNLDNYRLAFSRDGKWFAASGGVVRVWNTGDWSVAGEFKSSSSIDEVAFSPDGNSLYLADYKLLERRNWRTGKSEQTYGSPESSVTFQLAQAGALLLASEGYKHQTTLFDTASGKSLVRHASEGYYDVKLHPDGGLFLGQCDREWWVGNVRDAKREKLEFPAIAVEWRNVSEIWSLEKNTQAIPIEQAENEDNPFGDPPGHQYPSVLRARKTDPQRTIMFERPLSFAANRLLVSGDNQIVVALDDTQVQVFTAPDWKSIATWKLPPPHSSPDGSARRRVQWVLSHDARWLATATERAYPQLFEVRTGKRAPVNQHHCSEITGMNFADDNTIRTRDADGVVLRWNANTGRKLAHVPDDADHVPESHDRWDDRSEGEVVAEDGAQFYFEGQDGGPYQQYKSYDVYRVDQGMVIDRDVEPYESQPGVTRVGKIEPKWGQHEWIGLVPGGEYLHVATQIFSRRDLKPISAANVRGDISQLHFSRDGGRYILLAHEQKLRRSEWGADAYLVEQVDYRLRVHDTRTGKILFAIPISDVELVALSPDQSRLAAVYRNQLVQIWTLPLIE